ncbi:MAG TPA: alanine racemase [Deltaproteobacteria bacterium]|nr:alanine racemase [Deltaproteobacteria bacterium]
MRPTRVIIDLTAIRDNLRALRTLTRKRILMAIKADAYGHGASTVGRFVEEKSLVDMLGVSSIEEGLQLRDAGVTLPILIFGLINDTREDIEAICAHDLMPTLVDSSLVSSLAAMAQKWHRPIKVQIKTDTGMGRLGFRPEETLKTVQEIANIPQIVISGIYTHFPVSDCPGSSFTAQQLRTFKEFLFKIEALSISCGDRHAANSGAILNYPDSYLDMIRPGLLCYGLYPSGEETRTLPVTPAMTLKTAIMFVKRVKKGTGLSYGLTYTVEKDSTIATIPIGYADGYPRVLSNRAHVIIGEKTYPVAGRICMDQTLIDLGDDFYPVGEEVTIFGAKTITAATVATWCESIPYETVCNMSRRVPRTYSEHS